MSTRNESILILSFPAPELELKFLGTRSAGESPSESTPTITGKDPMSSYPCSSPQQHEICRFIFVVVIVVFCFWIEIFIDTPGKYLNF